MLVEVQDDKGSDLCLIWLKYGKFLAESEKNEAYCMFRVIKIY